MVKNSGKRERNGDDTATKVKLNDDVDALFRLPLAEFTGARNALASRLKQAGRANDANLIKILAKPPISAWAVNQLYWNHGDAFEELLVAGQHFRRAQKAGNAAEVRRSLDARREALAHLSNLADSLLRDAGHNAALDTLRRITATLEALSAYESASDGPTPGRLTQDVDPPGFESLASLIAAGTTKASKEPSRVAFPQKSIGPGTNTRQKAPKDRDVRPLEDTRQIKIAAARVSLQVAKKSLTDARAKAQRLDAAQRRANAESKDAEKEKREAEARFKRLSSLSEDAAQRAQSITAEAREAAKAVEDAKRSLEKATKELESLFRESAR
jgi:hypothetical protein